MEKLLNKVITIKEVAVEEKRLKVVDMEGKVYSIWRTKKDGAETQAYSTFKLQALSAQGKSYEIGYDETPNPQGPGTFYRAIKMIKEASAIDAQMAKPFVPKTPQNDTQDLLKRIERLEEKVFGVTINF